MSSSTSKSLRDLIAILTTAGGILAMSLWYDPFSRAVSWFYHHDNWKLDELFTVIFLMVIGLAWYSWRRWKELVQERRERARAEEEYRRLALVVNEMLGELRTLHGLLRICEQCKRVRDDTGYWIPLEAYIESNSKARFFPGICPDCSRRLYGREHRDRPSQAL
ncbi:MAG TPA: hypothetical protein VEO56_10680 [Bacteroidota bacterium]|nr:hypothetical protein [Bacteroidota bacterium]